MSNKFAEKSNSDPRRNLVGCRQSEIPAGKSPRPDQDHRLALQRVSASPFNTKDAMNVQPHQLPLLYKETVNFLDRLAGEVRENKNVMLASQFARWLNFSGLIQILNQNPSTKLHLEVDGAVLQRKVNDLNYECGELFRGGKHDPKYAASDIAEINRKLDSLLETRPVPAAFESPGRRAAGNGGSFQLMPRISFTNGKTMDEHD